jgi:hypothetical protein
MKNENDNGILISIEEIYLIRDLILLVLRDKINKRYFLDDITKKTLIDLKLRLDDYLF